MKHNRQGAKNNRAKQFLKSAKKAILYSAGTVATFLFFLSTSNVTEKDNKFFWLMVFLFSMVVIVLVTLKVLSSRVYIDDIEIRHIDI